MKTQTQTLFTTISIIFIATLFLYSGCRDWDVKPDFASDGTWEFDYLVIGTVSESSAQLAWQGYSGNPDIVISGFEINKKVDSGSYEIIATVGGNTSTYIDDNLNTQQHVYTYYINAVYETIRFSSEKKIYDFACGYDIYTDPRDGNTYKTVGYGYQCWFAQNLKYLPAVYPADEINDEDARYFVYGYDGYNVAEAKMNEHYSNYGVLYNNLTLATACPVYDGWQVSNQNDWDYLIAEAGHEQNAGGNLKEKGTNHWLHPNTAATNILEFSARPGGMVNINEGFTNISKSASFWAGVNYVHTMYYDSSAISTDFYTNFSPPFAASIRCVRRID